MAIDVVQIMGELGTALESIAGLRVYPFPPKSAQAPFAFVDMPERIDFDMTFGRAQDRMTLQVIVGVSSQVDRASWLEATQYAAGSGAKSVKEAIEAAEVGASVRVQSVEFGMIALSSGVFSGLTFLVDVVA